MVAAGLSFFLWLLLASLHEVPGCRRVFHRAAGDVVELPSCLPAQDVTFARWNYQGRKVASADAEDDAREAGRFAGRLQLNRRNFSLTLRPVTPEDSGVFSFVSAVNDSQRETVEITLRIYEPITEEPVVTVTATRHAANRSCGLLLNCSASAGGGPLEYEWRVGNRSLRGAWNRVSVPLRGAATEVTCTVFNAVSAKSTSAAVTCANDTAYSASATDPSSFAVVLGVAAGTFCLFVTAAGIVAAACRRSRRRTSRKCEEATVYADIGDVTAAHVSVRTTEPLYDKIQLSRMALQGHAP